MAIGANSYGSIDEVEAESASFVSEAGNFDTTTTPTLETVENFIDRISAFVNASLGNEGFSVPVTDADAKLVLDLFVIEETKKMIRAVNIGKIRGARRLNIIGDESLLNRVAEWVKENAIGLENLGASRTVGRKVKTVAVTRVDGYSDDLDSVEMT